MACSLFMDVHVPAAVTHQLRRRGVDVLTAQDDGAERTPDAELLERSTGLGRVMVTQDIRFRALAEDWQRAGRRFAGLAFGHQELTIGRMVKDLELISKCVSPGDVANQVIHLPI